MAGQLVKRADNVYLVRVYIGRVDGKRQYKNKTVHGTKREAQQVLNSLLREKFEDLLIPSSTMLSKDAIELWLREDVQPRTRESTYNNYRDVTRRHLVPILGTVPLRDVTTEKAQDLVAAMIRSGYSARYVRYTSGLLRNFLGCMVRRGLIPKNPTDGIVLPRKQHAERQYLTPPQVRKLLDVCEGQDLLLLSLLVTGGLRPSEAAALRWDDVTDSGVQINRTVERLKGGKWRFEGTKTLSSRRLVHLPEQVLSMLREHRASSKSALVFPNGDEPMDLKSYARNKFKRLLKEAGLSPSIRLYDLRHTCATLLLLAGEHPKKVADRLGHSSITVTLDTYSHVMPSMQQEGSEKLSRMLWGSDSL